MVKTISITHTISENEFERWIGRKPVGEEFSIWCDWIRMSCDNQIDWDLSYRLGTEEFKNDNEDDEDDDE